MARLTDLRDLPGHDLVERGLADLSAGVETPEAALVSMAAPRLRSLGLEVPDTGIADPDHRLYDLLSDEDAAGAHSRYNALVGRIVSFARAAEHASSR